MLVVRTIQFTKAELDALPRRHRLAFLGLSQISDETVILQRTGVAAVNSIAPPRPVEDMAKATGLLALRMLVGRLWEARLFINTPEVAVAFQELSASALELDNRSQPEIEKAARGRASLFRRLDAQGGIVRELRNRSSFHTDMELLEAGYNALGPDVEMFDHIGPTKGSTIHGSSEALHLAAICALLNEPDVNRAFRRAIDEIMPAVYDLTTFIDGFSTLFLLTHFLQKIRNSTSVEIPDAVPINQIQSTMFFKDAD